MYINNWNEVPDGARVIQDTYLEVYEVFTKNGKRYLRIVDFETKSKNKERLQSIGEEIEIDFNPDCIYDQLWIRID